MAHWTLEHAKVCTTGGTLVGPVLDPKQPNGYRIVWADVVSSVLHWDRIAGHRGSVVLLVEGVEYIRERLFLELIQDGWEPVLEGESINEVKRRVRAQIRKNKRDRERSEKMKKLKKGRT